MATHTPVPWEVSKHGTPDYCQQYGIYAEGANDHVIVKGDNAKADAEFIQSACNCHEDLLAGLISARKTIADILDNCPYFFPDRGDASKLTAEQQAWRKKAEAASRVARAVIAKAEGRAT